MNRITSPVPRIAAALVAVTLSTQSTLSIAAPSTPPRSSSSTDPAPATPPTHVPSATERVTSPGVPTAGPRVVDPAIDALLDDLERAGDALRDFQARMVYEKVDGLMGGAELRYGRVLHRRLGPGDAEPGAEHRSARGGSAGDPAKAGSAGSSDCGSLLAIFFDEFVDGTGRKDAIDQRYIFAEGWLVEIDSERKQFIKRQIVPPGKSFDPLKLGEGPFPLPVGQRKSEVLARFLVSPAPAPTVRLLKGLDLATLRSIRLVPIAGTRESDEFSSVDLYYDPATLLPIGVVAEAPDGSVKSVRLRDVKRNEGISPEDQKLISVETPDPRAWIIDVRPWSGED